MCLKLEDMDSLVPLLDIGDLLAKIALGSESTSWASRQQSRNSAPKFLVRSCSVVGLGL